MIPRELLRKVRRIELRSRRLVNDVFAGSYHSVFKGRGIEFDEVREYTVGDDVRTIDWNVTARMGQPFVKKYVEERELTVVLIVDVSASHHFGSRVQLKRDLIAELAAVLAFSAIRNNDRVGLLMFSEQVERFVPPRKGVAHGLRVIREVLAAEPQRLGTDVGPALEFLTHALHRQAVVFLMSDFLFPDPCVRRMAVAARRHDLIAVIVSDRRELAWPRVGVVDWQDAETGSRRVLDSSNSQVRRALTELVAAHRTTWLDWLRRMGVDTIQVATGEPYDRALVQFFRERQRRLHG